MERGIQTAVIFASSHPVQHRLYAPLPSHWQCGRGGIGRRAALRSLWGNSRGSSSLLDRTISLRKRLLIRHFGVFKKKSQPVHLADFLMALSLHVIVEQRFPGVVFQWFCRRSGFGCHLSPPRTNCCQSLRPEPWPRRAVRSGRAGWGFCPIAG